MDDSLGAVSVSGMQFATDGYVVEGDPITLVGAPDASSASATGPRRAPASPPPSPPSSPARGLRKTDLGTLVLSGANSYTGGTAIDGGTVEIADDAELGAPAGALASTAARCA